MFEYLCLEVPRDVSLEPSNSEPDTFAERVHAHQPPLVVSAQQAAVRKDLQ